MCSRLLPGPPGGVHIPDMAPMALPQMLTLLFACIEAISRYIFASSRRTAPAHSQRWVICAVNMMQSPAQNEDPALYVAY